MIQLNDIKIMNETMIVYLKKIGISCQRNEIIKNIFNDETCFFKMNKDDAFTILNDVGIKDNIDEVYKELVSNDVYYDLHKNGKIKENDENIIIKYKIYNENNLFNKKKSNNYNKKPEETAIIIHKETFFYKIIRRLRSFWEKILK